MSTDTVTMHIGELAERTGLSSRTLRHYDEVGLVRASGRTEGGFRLYTQDDFDRLILIRRMKPLGFTLDEMAELLRIIDSQPGTPALAAEEEHTSLESFIGQAVQRREQLRAQLAMADEFLELLRERHASSGE